MDGSEKGKQTTAEFALSLKAANHQGYNLRRFVGKSCEPPPVVDSATIAAATPDDDTTTVGTLGHLAIHHLQGGKLDYGFPFISI